MAIRISNNIEALQQQQKLAISSQKALATSLQRLSSGFRINSPKDNILLNVNAQIAKSQTAARFQQDTISVLQTIDGGLNETHSALSRMRELATQAANPTSDESQRAALQDEFTNYTEYLTSFAESSSYGRDKLVDGSLELVTQTMDFGGQNRSIKIADMRAEALGVSDLSIRSTEDAQNALTRIDQAIAQVAEQRKALGEEQGIVSTSNLNRLSNVESTVAKSSRITDRDFANELVSFTRAQILQQAGSTMLAQANSLPQSVLALLRG